MHHTLFLVFNHKLTQLQELDARKSLGVDRIVPLPEDIQAAWSDIPPDAPEIRLYLEPVMQWLKTQAVRGDYVLIQGDFGACCLMAVFSNECGFVPIYSTTLRKVVEEQLPDGTVRLTHHFQHRRFRRYGA